jgi:hypothetical protein
MPIIGSFGSASGRGFGQRGGGGPIYDYLLVVAGGGTGGYDAGGGGGGGGFRILSGSSISPGPYPIVVGAGGAGGSVTGSPEQFNPPLEGNNGNNSSALGFSSTGGGKGGSAFATAQPGGSGGGGVTRPPVSPVGSPGGAGNAGAYSPPEGNDGGNASPSPNGLGGGGAGGAGGAGFDAGQPGCRCGNAAGQSGIGSPVTAYFGGPPQPFYSPDPGTAGDTSQGYFSGGGFAAQRSSTCGCGVNNTTLFGGGGFAKQHTASPLSSPPYNTNSFSGTANSGGGGGTIGAQGPQPGSTNSGGSGRVLIRFPADLGPAISVSPPSNTIVSNPLGTIANFTVTGTLTVA